MLSVKGHSKQHIQDLFKHRQGFCSKGVVLTRPFDDLFRDYNNRLKHKLTKEAYIQELNAIQGVKFINHKENDLWFVRLVEIDASQLKKKTKVIQEQNNISI
jgi:hypothetical protein